MSSQNERITGCTAGRSRPAIVFVLLVTALATAFSSHSLTAEQQRAAASRDPLASLRRDIDGLLTGSSPQRGTWGVAVKTLAGETIYAANASKLFVPASNMKIVTLAAAAERLGWDFRFETRLVASGSIDENGLAGDLVVVGSGDPTIDDWDGAAAHLFEEWAEELKRAGVHAIRGRIVGDDDSFDDELWGPGWAWDDLDRSFAAGVGALQFNQNTAQITLGPGPRAGDPATVAINPPGSGLSIRNAVTTSAGEPQSISTRRGFDDASIEVRGSLRPGSAAIVRNIAVANPTLYFVTALREALVKAGIDVQQPPVDIDDIPDPPSRARGYVLLRHLSPPLSVMASTMMHLSQNLYAETLLKTMGTQRVIGSTASGTALLRQTLEAWGISSEDVRVADGSGLSVYNLVSPDALVGILSHMALDARLRGPFEASLATPGEEGTLAQRLRGTPAENNLRAKTGSLSNARALSGYVWTAEHEQLVFSILVNNFGSEAVERTMDAIVLKLAQFSRR